MGPQSVLYQIGPYFVGKTYRHQVSGNCCVKHADEGVELQDFGFDPDQCNLPGPFVSPPIPGGTSCTNVNMQYPDQLTLCMSARDVQCIRPYHLLTLADRNLNFNDGEGGINYCDSLKDEVDSEWQGPGWYRLAGYAGSRMPEQPVEPFSCGTDAAGWLKGPHPAVEDGVVPAEVCFSYGDPCEWSTEISVVNCYGFYLYELVDPPYCSSRYCGEGEPIYALFTNATTGLRGDIQYYDVPDGVTQLRIEAAGAKGGGGRGGLGAKITGTFEVTPGETLQIIVGQMGGLTSQGDYCAGGGGGTYVYRAADHPSYTGADGGFGGGGSGADNSGSGGGGGYNGGGAGNNYTSSQWDAGGGGGSFNSGTQHLNESGVNADHGYVLIMGM